MQSIVVASMADAVCRRNRQEIVRQRNDEGVEVSKIASGDTSRYAS